MAKASNNKMLVGAVILIAVIAIGYFVLIGNQKELSFSDGKKELDSILAKNSLSIEDLQNAIELPEKQIFATTKNSLTDFKSNLSGYKKTDETAALSDLADLYVGFFDALIDTKTVEEKASEIGTELENSPEQLCDLAPSISEIVSDSEAILAKAKSLNLKIASFEKNYPSFAQTAKTENLKTNEEEIQTSIETAKSNLEAQTANCTATE